MSYSRSGAGTVEIDLTGRSPSYYPPAYYSPPVVARGPSTPEEAIAGAVIGVTLLAIIGVIIWKSPRGAWVPQPYYEPSVRIRLNRKKRLRKKKSFRR